MSPMHWRRVPPSRCRSFRSLAEISPKMVEYFCTLIAGLLSRILFTVCLGSATQKQKFLLILGLMEYRK